MVQVRQEVQQAMDNEGGYPYQDEDRIVPPYPLREHSHKEEEMH